MKKTYDFIIVIIILFALFWFAGFFLFYMNVSTLFNNDFKKRADYIFDYYNNFRKFEDITLNDLLYIVEYDKEDFADKKYLFIKKGYKEEDIFKFKNSFIYTKRSDSRREFLIVFSDISPLFHYIITFSLILGTVFFLTMIYFFYNQKEKRNKGIAGIINYLNNDTIPREENFADDDIFEMYQTIVKKNERSKTNEENLGKLIKILQMENNSLKDKDSKKRGVIENISHELKSPMTKIKGYLDYLYSEKMGELKETQKDALIVVRKNVDALLNQIDQVIKYAKDESFLLEREIFDIKKLLLSVISTHSKDALKKNILIEYNIENLKSPILGDKTALFEVFDNLLINALKFTNKNGKIKIIAYEKMENETLNAVIKFEDTGIGIPHDKFEKIFDRFFQVEHEASRRYPGMGLGLTIVKMIVEAHKGSVTVTSVIGQGSTFKIILPIKRTGGVIETGP